MAEDPGGEGIFGPIKKLETGKIQINVQDIVTEIKKKYYELFIFSIYIM